jgi:ABC-2 type transport system permease protein
MNKLFLVARYEYLRFVRRRSFVLAVLSLPLFIVLIMAIGEFASRGDGVDIGYVDEAGLLRPAIVGSTGEEELDAAAFQAFPSASSGRAALEAGTIDTLFIVPAGYLQDRSLQAFTIEGDVGSDARSAFGEFIKASLAAGFEPPVAERLVQAPEVTVRAPAGDREVEPSAVFLHFLLPFAAGFLFIMAAVTSAGYLLQTVTDEKENRTIEILATSVSATELVVGKTLGLIAVAGTQLAVWLAGLVVAIMIGTRYIEPLAQVEPPWFLLGLATVFFVPAFLLLAGMMVCLGGAFPEYRQSQQLVGVINILFFVPFFFISLILSDPNGTIAILLTFFPTTSFLTVLLRWPATVVPLWQLAGAWVLLTATAGLLVWSAPRIFRAGMLRYGQRLTLHAVWQALSSGGR